MSTSLQQVRAFIALDVGPDVRAAMRPLMERLRTLSSQVRWVPESNWHLTAKFLGDVDGCDIVDIARTLQEEAARQAPFEVAFRGLKPFPPGRDPRIIALDVSSGAEALAAFHQRLDQRMLSFGIPSENRRFLAHLTLGRVKGANHGTRLWDAIAEHAETEFETARMEEAVLFQSNLRPGGAEYCALARAPFGG